MRIFSDFSEFKAAVGSEVDASEWIEATQERINLFARATCDDQWIHVRGRTSIAEVEDVPPDGLRVNYHMVIEIEGGQRPACAAELIALRYL
jgi:acyl dehydratase